MEGLKRLVKFHLWLVAAALAAVFAVGIALLVQFHLAERGYFLPKENKELARRLLEVGEEQGVFHLSQVVGEDWVWGCAMREYANPNHTPRRFPRGGDPREGLAWRTIEYNYAIHEGIWPIFVQRANGNVVLFHIPRNELFLHADEAICFGKEDARFGIRMVPHGEYERLSLVYVGVGE